MQLPGKSKSCCKEKQDCHRFFHSRGSDHKAIDLIDDLELTRLGNNEYRAVFLLILFSFCVLFSSREN